MKVLMVNKFFRPVGGPETIIRDLTDVLEKDGHEVVPFSMQHPDNWPSEWSDYFVSNVDYRGGKYGAGRQLSEAMRMIYSTEAKRKITTLVRKTRPDIAHLHNIYHQLSPSILPALKKAGVATLLTLHDGKLMCPAYHFLVNGQVCEKCAGKRFYNCAINRCIKNSRAKSLLCTIEMHVHGLMRIYERNTDLFIAPSEFYRSKLLATGRVSPEQVVTIHNGTQVESVEPTAPGNYALYVGKMDAHKGVLTLIRAMEHCPDLQLIMAGQGEAMPDCVRLIEEKGLKNVVLAGFKSGNELAELLRGAAFLVTPSEWYENCPMVVLEAAAYGKPAIVTDIGGIPELVEHEKTGLITPPGDMPAMVEKIKLLTGNRDLLNQMGRNARQKAEREFSYSVHYKALLKAYSRAQQLAGK